MNSVNSILQRQQGCGFTPDYDIALYRLKNYYNDVYHGITPNENSIFANPEPPVFACQFSSQKNQQHIIALANEDGKIALQDTSQRRTSNKPLEGTQAHCNTIFDIAWMPDEAKLVTTSGDHTTRLWDVSRPEISLIQDFQAHTRSVKTAVFRHDDKAVFATGARDGAIMIWDIRASQAKPDNCIHNAHGVGCSISTKRRRAINHTSRTESITGLAFQDDFTLLSCVAGDGSIKVWDLRKNYTVHKKDPIAKHVLQYAGNSTRNGFSSLLVCPARITLYASCMDNIIYAYGMGSYNSKPVAEFWGHQNGTYYVKTCLSPDGRYLASGSSDGNAYIWHTSRSGSPLVTLVGHTEEVTSVAWCKTGAPKIVTCSDDSYQRIWRVGLEHKAENDEIKIRGHAEAVLNITSMEHKRLETTPTAPRRRVSFQEHTPPSDNTGSPSEPGTVDKYNQSRTGSLKRNFSQMIRGWRSDGKLISILSPIEENNELLSKRPNNEKCPRRLFSQSTNDPPTVASNLDEPSTSSLNNRSNQLNFSPTLNLPNYVIDGTTPHQRIISPQKCKENIDWLTKIRKERYDQSNPTQIVSDKSNSSKSSSAVRRRKRSKSTESQKIKSPSPSLLNFLKIEKDIGNREHGSNSKSNIT